MFAQQAAAVMVTHVGCFHRLSGCWHDPRLRSRCRRRGRHDRGLLHMLCLLLLLQCRQDSRRHAMTLRLLRLLRGLRLLRFGRRRLLLERSWHSWRGLRRGSRSCSLRRRLACSCWHCCWHCCRGWRCSRRRCWRCDHLRLLQEHLHDVWGRGHCGGHGRRHRA